MINSLSSATAYTKNTPLPSEALQACSKLSAANENLSLTLNFLIPYTFFLFLFELALKIFPHHRKII
jgi:hypothetical protein